MASLACASQHAVVARGNNAIVNHTKTKTNNARKLGAVAPIRCSSGGESSGTVDSTSYTTTTAAAAAAAAAVSTASPSSSSRRAALVGAAAAALSAVVTPAGPAAAGNLLEDFAESQLASKGKLFMAGAAPR